MDTSDTPTPLPQGDISQIEVTADAQSLLKLKNAEMTETSVQNEQEELNKLNTKFVKAKLLKLENAEATEMNKQITGLIEKAKEEKSTTKALKTFVLQVLSIFKVNGFDSTCTTLTDFVVRAQFTATGDSKSQIVAAINAIANSKSDVKVMITNMNNTTIKTILCHLAEKLDKVDKEQARTLIGKLHVILAQVSSQGRTLTPTEITNLKGILNILLELEKLGRSEMATTLVEDICEFCAKRYLDHTHAEIRNPWGVAQYPTGATNSKAGLAHLTTYLAALMEEQSTITPEPKTKNKEKETDQIQRLQDLLTRERNKNGNSDQRARERNNNSKTPTRVGAVEEKPLKAKCAYCEKHAPKNGLVTHYKSKDNMCFGERLDKGVDDAGQKLTMAKRTALIESLSRLTGGKVIYTGTA